MVVNKKASRKANALRLTAARKENLASCRRAAFNSGTSRNALCAAIRAACGPRPVLTLADAVRFEVVIGLMAAALARQGDNRPEAALTDQCRLLLTKYQGHGGKAKLRKGMKGRRTKAQEDAYASARVQWSTLARDAGVKLPTKSGSNSTGRKPRPATAKKAVNDSRPATPKLKTPEQVYAYGLQQAKAMLTVCNRNAKLKLNPAFTSAVQDFHDALKKLNG